MQDIAIDRLLSPVTQLPRHLSFLHAFLIILGVALILMGAIRLATNTKPCGGEAARAYIQRSLENSRASGSSAPRIASGVTYTERVATARAAANAAITPRTVDASSMAPQSLSFNPTGAVILADAVAPAVAAERSRNPDERTCKVNKSLNALFLALGICTVLAASIAGRYLFPRDYN